MAIATHDFWRAKYRPIDANIGWDMSVTSTMPADEIERVSVTASSINEAYEKFARENEKRAQREKELHYRMSRGDWTKIRGLEYDQICVDECDAPQERPSSRRHQCVEFSGLGNEEFQQGLIDYYEQLRPDLVKEERKFCSKTGCLLTRIKTRCQR
jgi:hypothetical protein